ncbi:MAG TPA: hypothetical protein PLT06_03745 [Syntrophorhabdaceae bacterium]|jgi:hypothetical protein|nr:hypothetical protein [Syntrophorhabdaceae bacterium]MDI9561643.1 hypothetical protein [Pseudomonadota bacterium]MBP8699373.1 hypothetical protein [Syntrophorhabdaceae bacterium]MBV6505098.1 hypothetical protein [Syntrophorhabdaceae bacterium]HNQ64213.1 hypothetical protein [Syntrophorhabdaceae bacterium]
MNNKGKVGCGCLVFILVICMVLAGISMHPISLKFIGNQFRYEDKIFQSDIVLVPRFSEDKNGELYIEAFREFWAGNGRGIWLEDDKILGISVSEIVMKQAKERGIKEGIIKKIGQNNGDKDKIEALKKHIERTGAHKVIIIVPEYASRRFHLLYSSNKENEKSLFLIKPVAISAFKKDKWWKDTSSRELLLNEFFLICSHYFNKFKYGTKDK